MLRHHLQQGVCSRTFRIHCVTTYTRTISGVAPSGEYARRPLSSSSRLSERNQSLDKSAQPSHGQSFSGSVLDRSEGFNSSTRSEKFSNPPRTRWRTEPSRPDQSDTRDNNRESFKRKHWSAGHTRRNRGPRKDLGSHLYDNYKPRAIRSETKLPEAQSPLQVDKSFDILQAMRTVFPHVKEPTSIQARLIPAIMEGQDVILMDETGSGKTFGSILALLPEIHRPHSGISTLYVVPHRDLAYQIESWCQKLVAAQPSSSIDPSTVARVIARPNTTHRTLAEIRKNPPRILISTPGALVDAMQMGNLRLEASLRRIVIDEVDAVMKIPLRYHQVQLRNYHVPEVAQVIDKLLRLMWEARRPKPQMVMMSATLTTHVRTWLFKQKGWMADRVVRLHGIHEKLESGEFESSEHTLVSHSAIVVEADGRLRNLNDEQDTSQHKGERGILSENPEAVLELLDQEGEGESSWVGTNSDSSRQTTTRLVNGLTLPSSVLEAVATSVALDVSHRALLVIPTGVSIDPVVETLRGFGVETRTLNLREEIEHVSTRLEEEALKSLTSPNSSRDSQTTTSDRASLMDREEGEELTPNPTLLVATTTAVRGIDIPTLSHVYIVGGLESEEAYRHVAGRVGRFGMPGSVISFVGADGAEKLLGGTGERRIRRTLERIGVENTPFTHI